MGAIIRMDYKNIFKSTKFKIVALIIIFIPIIAFLLSCKFYYGKPLDFIRAGTEENFISGMVSRQIKLWYILILPLLASLLCSDVYSNQFNNGIYKSILTRCSKRDYIVSKIITVFTVTTIIIFISLILNQILSLIAFPIEAIDNARGVPSFDIGYNNFDKEAFLDILRLENIYLYNLSYFILFSLTGGLYALIALGITFFVKNTKVSTVLMFIIYFGVYIVFVSTGMESYHLNYYLDAFNQGTIYFIAWMSFLVAIPSILVMAKLQIRDEM